MLERRGQHHDRAEVDLTTKEAHRRRRPPPPTALDGAAEASARRVIVAEFELVSAARTPRAVRDVEPTSAERTPGRRYPRREIVVDPRQQQQHSGIDGRFVAQVGPPSDLPVERRGTPRWLEWSSSSRGFRYSPRCACSRCERLPSKIALLLTWCGAGRVAGRSRSIASRAIPSAAIAP